MSLKQEKSTIVVIAVISAEARSVFRKRKLCRRAMELVQDVNPKEYNNQLINKRMGYLV